MPVEGHIYNKNNNHSIATATTNAISHFNGNQYPQQNKNKNKNNNKHQSNPLSLRVKNQQISPLRLSSAIILAVSIILVFLAFVTTSWLKSDTHYYSAKFNKLGLWRYCFNSFQAPNDYEQRKFYVGCRWIFADDYKPIRSLLMPTFFIATQVFFTAGFLLLLFICAGIVAVHQCFIIEREDYAFRALSVASSLSGFTCTLGVIIFALNANSDDWMPDPNHNYFSWSFVSALIGSLLLWVVAMLFYIEMQLVIKRNHRSNSQVHMR